MPTKAEPPWTLDTGVLVYATAMDAPAHKQARALSLLEQLLRGAQACICGQVLSEYVHLVLRRQAMSAKMASDATTQWSGLMRVLGTSAPAYKTAWELSARHQYPMWDALTIAVCAEHGVARLYSEQTGALKRPLGVEIVNPFHAGELPP